MGAVTAELSTDKQSLLWKHDCTPLDVSHLDADTADWYLKQRAKPRKLPLGPGGWELVQENPLTIAPSILCGTCQIHGFVTNGKWVEV